MAVILREYQDGGVADIRAAFATARRVLYVLSTGGGKTVVFTYISQHAVSKGRVLLVAHRREICEQISLSLQQFGVPHGLIMPGERQTYDMVQVGMVQTVARRLHKIEPPNLLIIDEAAHAPIGSWAKVANHFPEAKILGVTATPLRLSGEGLHLSFDKLVNGPSMKWLIDNGYLCTYKYYAPQNKMDLSKIHIQGGDYKIDELAREVDKAVITGSAVNHYTRYLNGRPTIVFCTTMAHSEHVRDQFLAAGFRAENIDGNMTTEERRDRITRLGNGQLNILTSVMILTEGVDIPIACGCIILRPTKSLSLYLQMVGRVMRPKPDGSGAIILDHVNNVSRHGLPDDEREWSLEGRRITPKPPSQCKRCFSIYRTRPDCKDTACPFLQPPKKRDEKFPDEIDGDLREMAAREANPEWAKGCNIALAKGDEFKALLRHAGPNLERLQLIARIRNYDGRWPFMVMKGWYQ